MSVKNVTAKGTEITRDARLNYPGTTIAASFGKYLNSAGQAVTDSSLPAATQALVKIRASQINCCAACTDAHTKDAEHAGGNLGPAQPGRGVAGGDSLHRR